MTLIVLTCADLRCITDYFDISSLNGSYISDIKSIMTREKFNAWLEETEKGSNTIFSKEKYDELVQKVLKLKSSEVTKKPNDYDFLKHYDVFVLGGKSRLIYPIKNNVLLYYAITSDLYDIIKSAHVTVGHGGRDRTFKELNKQYKNITLKQVLKFVALCEPCLQKKKMPRKGVVVKPLLFKEFNSRCQVDLIDFQSQPDEDFKFILNYQDHLTKFVVLRPLKSKTAVEVAENLVDIFTTFGAPSVLQSDNGREFANQVIESLRDIWPVLKIVHGAPRHSQSQGSIERANGDVENILTAWMSDNSSSQWTKGLRFVQLMKNSAYHSGIKMTPYEALFGVPVKVGLSSSYLPKDMIENISTEEELNLILRETSENDNQDKDNENMEKNAGQLPNDVTANIFVEEQLPQTSNEASGEKNMEESNDEREEEKDKENQDPSDPSASSIVSDKAAECISSEKELDQILESNETSNANILSMCATCMSILSYFGAACELCSKKATISQKRSNAFSNLEVQAKRMRAESDRKYSESSVGSTVRIPVPEVDRGRGDPRSVLGVVLSVDNGFYEIGTRSGTLKNKLVRSQFDACKEKIIDQKEVPDSKEISIRSVATQQSLGTGQGYQKCNCKGDCQNRRCLCFKNNIKCKSKCHSSSSKECKNK